MWRRPDIPIPYVLLLNIPLPDIPIPDMPKRKIEISIMFDVFLPNIPIPHIYTKFIMNIILLKMIVIPTKKCL